MNQVTPPSGVKGSAPVSPVPKSNVAVEPGEQFYERALRRRIRSWPDVSAAGFLTVELSQYLKGTGGATAEAVMAARARRPCGQRQASGLEARHAHRFRSP